MKDIVDFYVNLSSIGLNNQTYVGYHSYLDPDGKPDLPMQIRQEGEYAVLTMKDYVDDIEKLKSVSLTRLELITENLDNLKIPFPKTFRFTPPARSNVRR